MGSTRQKIKIFYNIVIIIGFNFFTFAQNNTGSFCSTCGGPSIEITNFIELSNKIIDTIPNNSEIEAKGSKYKVFGPWQGGLYNSILGSKNPGSIVESIVQGNIKNFNKRQSYIRGTTELLSIYSIDIIKDGGLGFIVASQPWPIVRDYQLLLDIDTIVGDKIYEIGAAGGYGKKLKEQDLDNIKNIIYNNAGEGKIFKENPKIGSLTTTQTLSLLLRINNRIKKILTLGGSLSDITITLGGGNETEIKLNEGYFESLKKNYSCTRIGKNGKSCSSNFTNFKKNITNITKTFKENGPDKSREKIETASKRLATRSLQIIGKTDSDFFKSNKLDYEQREAEILSSQGLVKRSGLSTLTGALSLRISRQTINNRGAITGSRENIKETSVSGIKYINKLTENITYKNIKDMFYQNKSNFDLTLLPESPQQKIISNDINNIINIHQNILDTQLQNTTTDTQEAIGKTLFHIRLLNIIIRENIKEDLARTCELQCSNLGGICR